MFPQAADGKMLIYFNRNSLLKRLWPMPLRWIDSVWFPVTLGRGAAARRFNGDYLGPGEVDFAVAPSVYGGGWSERNRVRIVRGVDRGFRAARKAHLAFVTGDFEAALERYSIDGSVPAQHGSLEGEAALSWTFPAATISSYSRRCPGHGRTLFLCKDTPDRRWRGANEDPS